MGKVATFKSKFKLASIREQLASRGELQRILSNIGWLLANNLIQIISGLLVGAWVARYLGPDDRGIMNYAVSFVALFLPLCALGLGGILVRELVRHPEEKGKLMGTAMVMQAVAYLILIPIMIAAVILLRPNDPYVQIAVIIVVIGNTFTISRTFQFWFESQLQSKYTVIARRGADLIAAIMKIALILMAAPLNAFLIVFGIQSVVVFAIQAFFYIKSGEKFRAWRFDLEQAKLILRDGWPLALSLLAVTINLRIDSVMLGQMLDNRSVGIYGEAARLSQLWYFVPLAISSSVYPALVRAHKEFTPEKIKKRDQQFFDSLASVCFLIAIPSAILAPLIVRILYGQAYAETATVLSIHIWALLFVGFGFGLRRWLAVEDLTVYSLWTALSGAVVNIVLNYIFIPKFGVIGAAWTMVFSSAVSGYFICLILPRLRPLFRQLTISLFLPFRVPILLYRRVS